MTERRKSGRKPLDIDPRELPNQARTLRMARDWSLTETAERLGVGSSALMEFELTGKGLGDEKQWRLVFLLDTNIQTLLTPGIFFAEKVRQSLDNVR